MVSWKKLGLGGTNISLGRSGPWYLALQVCPVPFGPPGSQQHPPSSSRLQGRGIPFLCPILCLTGASGHSSGAFLSPQRLVSSTPTFTLGPVWRYSLWQRTLLASLLCLHPKVAMLTPSLPSPTKDCTFLLVLPFPSSACLSHSFIPHSLIQSVNK